MIGFRLFSALLCVFAACTLTACQVYQVEHRGHITDHLPLEKLVAGQTTREQVQEWLGSPSSTSTFGEETWYYISTKLQQSTFSDSYLLENQVIALIFDEEGVLQSVASDQAENPRHIAFAEESTPTEGNEITVIEQLLGNLGRFNPGD